MAENEQAVSESEEAFKNFNENLINEFRANEGKVGGMFAGAPMLLLTTTGAKSGQQRVAPLVYITDNCHLVIVASKGGAPTHPDWYHNLRANPEVTVEVGTEKYQALAKVTDEADRQRLFAQMVSRMPGFAEYQKNTTRKIPVVVLERIAR